MTINVEFQNFEEMTAFAEKLIANEKQEAVKPVAKKTSKKEELPQEKERETAADKVDDSEEVNGAETPEVKEEPIAKEYTLEEVRGRLVDLTRSGKQKEVKSLLSSFGASNVSALSPEDYSALMERAGDL